MLDDKIKQLATEGKNFAALTTLLPDGTPMTQPVWVDADDDHVLVNTQIGRQKYLNMTRDPRVTIMIWDSTNPYVYAEVRGEVVGTVPSPEARSHLDELSRRYTGGDYANPITTDRVIVKVAPTKRQYAR